MHTTTYLGLFFQLSPSRYSFENRTIICTLLASPRGLRTTCHHVHQQQSDRGYVCATIQSYSMTYVHPYWCTETTLTMNQLTILHINQQTKKIQKKSKYLIIVSKTSLLPSHTASGVENALNNSCKTGSTWFIQMLDYYRKTLLL